LGVGSWELGVGRFLKTTVHLDKPLDLLSEISINFICDISEEPEKER
jgi:hypothetical protein